MQIQIATTNQSRVADTASTGLSVVLRDTNGGITGNTITATTLSTDVFEGTTSTQTSNFTLGNATHYLVDATSGAVTATLPSIAGNVVYTIVKKDSSGNAVTLATPLGTTSLTTQYQKVTIFNDGTSWFAV